jgi:DNA-binding beta-propeller fold protein YncE
MRTRYSKLLSSLPVLILFASGAHAQSPAGFDQWLGAASAALLFDAGATLPGDAIAYEISACVDNKMQAWSLRIDPASGSPRLTDRGLRTPMDCTPGPGPSGSPVAGPGVLVRAAAPGRTLKPAFRRVPFWPLYPAAAFPESGIACDPADNSSILAANYSLATVTRWTTCAGKQGTEIPVEPHPLQIANVPGSSLALVTSYDNGVNYIDMSADTSVFMLRTPPDVNPSGIAISPDGTTAYVTSINAASPALISIDIPGRRITRTVTLTAFPQSVFLSPDGTLAWVVHPAGDQIEIVDTLTGNVNRRLTVRSPAAVAFNSTGSKAYVTGGDGLLVLETTTYSTVATVSSLAGGGPVDVLVTPDDGLIAVANYQGKSISLIHPSSYAVSTISMGGSPRGLALVQ